MVLDLYAADPSSCVFASLRVEFLVSCVNELTFWCVCAGGAQMSLFSEQNARDEIEARYRKSSNVVVRSLLSHATVLQASLSDENVWKSSGIVIYCLQLQCFVRACMHAGLFLLFSSMNHFLAVF